MAKGGSGALPGLLGEQGLVLRKNLDFEVSFGIIAYVYSLFNSG